MLRERGQYPLCAANPSLNYSKRLMNTGPLTPSIHFRSIHHLIQSVLPQLTFSFHHHRTIHADFSGGQITSDAGLLPLRAFDQAHRLTSELAQRFHDPRQNERVPFFYYAPHLLLAHLIAIGINLVRYDAKPLLLIAPPSMGSPSKLFPADYGFPLWMVYAVWVAVLLLLYPLCLWFAQLKQGRHEWWLTYL